MCSRTLQLIKNFSLINESMVFKPGNILSTISQNKDIMARATIKEEFEQSFAIHRLVKLLGVISLFKDPELDFQEKFMRIKQDKEYVDYVYADPSHIISPGDKQIKMGETEINFDLPYSTMSNVMKALHVLELPSIAVIGDRSTIKLGAVDMANPSNNKYEIEVGNTEHEFCIVFKGEHLKLLPEDFKCSISSKGIGHFKGSDVEYWVTSVTKQSSFKK